MAMLIEQIDATGPKTPQRTFDGLTDAVGAAIWCAAAIHVKAKLGGNHDPVSDWLERFAHHFLISVRVMDFCRIEEGDAAFMSGADQLNSFGSVGFMALAIAQAHAAQTDRRDFKTTFAERSGFHAVLCLRTCGAIRQHVPSICHDYNRRKPSDRLGSDICLKS